MRLLLLNLLRKPLRTVLTVLGVGVAFLLFCFLEAVLTSFNAGVNMSDASRLIVQHKESIAFQLPMSYRQLIAQTEGRHRRGQRRMVRRAVPGTGSRWRETRGVLRPVRHRCWRTT